MKLLKCEQNTYANYQIRGKRNVVMLMRIQTFWIDLISRR